MDVVKYHQAAERALEWCLKMQAPDGSIRMQMTCLDPFYKWPLAFLAMGKYVEASTLLNWVETTTLKPDGDFAFAERKVLDDWHKYFSLYINSWLIVAAQKADCFGLADRAVRYILTHQHPYTGEFQSGTPHCGIACLVTGRLFEARRAADAFCLVVDQHDKDHPVFHFRLDCQGRLVRDFPEDKAACFCVDARETGQMHWYPGIGAALLCHIYNLTGDERYLIRSRDILEFLFQCKEDITACFAGGKVAYANALMYRITREEPYRDAAIKYLDWVVRLQKPDGHWTVDIEPYPWYFTCDLTGEMIYWITEICRIVAVTC